MSVCLALRLEAASPVWLTARGTSMLPWRLRGCELKIEPAGSGLEVGDILVFRRGPKLYFHRLIESINRQQWRTKGDTLVCADDPLSVDDILGCVTAERRGSRVREVRPDRSAAWLSDRLGRCFSIFGNPSDGFRHTSLRATYLVVLFGTWPFRRWLAPQRLTQQSNVILRLPGED